jgi:type IV pilus assembly protein PilZ
MGPDPSPGRQPRLFFLRIADTSALQHYYLEWVDSGGIFIPTPVTSCLGEKVFMVLSLADACHAVEARVVWTCPCRSPGDRPAGIGVQFNQAEAILQTTIEEILSKSPADKLEVPVPTF